MQELTFHLMGEMLTNILLLPLKKKQKKQDTWKGHFSPFPDVGAGCSEKFPLQ